MELITAGAVYRIPSAWSAWSAGRFQFRRTAGRLESRALSGGWRRHRSLSLARCVARREVIEDIRPASPAHRVALHAEYHALGRRIAVLDRGPRAA